MKDSQSPWRYVPLPEEHGGVLLGDLKEVPLNDRQCRRMERETGSARWLGRPVSTSVCSPCAMLPNVLSDRILVFGRVLPNVIPVAESLIWSKLDQSLDKPVYLIIPDWMDPAIASALRAYDRETTTMLPLRFGDHGQIWVGPELSAKSGHQWDCLLTHFRYTMPIRSYLLDQNTKAPENIPCITREQAVQGLDKAWHLLSRSAGRELIKHGVLHIHPDRRSRLHRFWRCDHFPDKKRGVVRPGSIVPARKWLSGLCGPISNIQAAPVRGLDAVWVSHADAPDASGFKGFSSLARALQIRGGSGAGETREIAITTALAEGFERMSAIDVASIPGIQAARCDLKGIVYDWSDLFLLADWQLKHQEVRLPGTRKPVALPVNTERPTLWLKMKCLGKKNEWRLLPRNYVLFGRDGENYPHAHSDGLGASRALPGAIASGLLEVVERDAIGIWWHNGAPRPAAPKEAYEAPVTMRIRDDLNRLGVKLWLLDITHDMGVPVVAAVCSDQGGGNILIGAAARFSYQEAGRKAALEIAQMLPLIMQPRRNLSREKIEWFERASIHTCPWLLPTTVEVAAKADVRKLRDLVARLQSGGLELLVINLSCSVLPVNAVKVVVPGLCSHRPVLGFARLHRVPEQLGWTTTRKLDCFDNQLQLYW